MCLNVTDEFSEDMLSAHESELDRMRGFYADNKDVFRLVEKRENLWNKMQEFEVMRGRPRLFEVTRGRPGLLPVLRIDRTSAGRRMLSFYSCFVSEHMVPQFVHPVQVALFPGFHPACSGCLGTRLQCRTNIHS